MASYRAWQLSRILVALCLGGLLVPAGGCTGGRQAERLRAGYGALEQQQFAEALAAADEYLRSTPRGAGSPEAAYLRGRAIEQRPKKDAAAAAADWAEARRAYLHALTLSPAPALAAYIHTSLANLAYFSDDYTTALAEFSAALPALSDPDVRVWALYRMALCYQRLGRFQEADQLFAQVQREFPDTTPAGRAASLRGTREFHVQVGTYQAAGSADRVIDSLRGQGMPARRIERPGTKLQVVLAGPYRNYSEAQTARKRLLGAYPDALIVP